MSKDLRTLNDLSLYIVCKTPKIDDQFLLDFLSSAGQTVKSGVLGPIVHIDECNLPLTMPCTGSYNKC